MEASVSRRVSDSRRRQCESLFANHAEEIWRAIYVYTGGRRDIADDSIAGAFLAALESQADIVDLRAWVYKASFRMALQELKRERREPASVPESDPLAPEELLDLLQALKTLPARQRAAAMLHYRAGYSTREVAEVMSTSESTVRVQLLRARRTLSRLLTQ